MNPMNYGYHSFNLLGFVLDAAFHLLLLALIIWFIIWLFRGPRAGRWSGPGIWHSHSAMSILNERYAKGEITKEEYEERKKTLMS